MATYYLCPLSTILQYFTDVGFVLANGKVNTYQAASSTPTPTYADSTGGVQNANPLTLNAAGRLNNVMIWQPAGVKLKVVVTDANNVQIGPTFDQIAGINDTTDFSSLLLNPAVGDGADLVANAVRSFDLVSSVRAAGAPTLSGIQTRVIDIQAAGTPGDGFGGLFYWDATNSGTDDGVNIIKPTGVSGNGRYIRQVAFVSGSFTATLTAMTAATTGAVQYRLYGKKCTLNVPTDITGTSNAGTMTMTGLPSIITPTLNKQKFPVSCVKDNGTLIAAEADIGNSGVITFYAGYSGSTGSFTAAGTKGITSGWTFSFDIS